MRRTARRPRRTHDLTQPLKLYETRVPADWIDYNGHMTESRYLEVFGNSSDALLACLGIDEAYHARGGSYFTVETHIMHLKETKALEPIHATVQVLAADDKRLHVFQTIVHTPTRRRAGDRRADAAACRHQDGARRPGRGGRADEGARACRGACGAAETGIHRTQRRPAPCLKKKEPDPGGRVRLWGREAHVA